MVSVYCLKAIALWRLPVVSGFDVFMAFFLVAAVFLTFGPGLTGIDPGSGESGELFEPGSIRVVRILSTTLCVSLNWC